MRETDSVAAMTTTGDPGDSSPPSSACAERSGGWIPGSRGDPAFRLSPDTISAIPVLISAPHGGRCYPPALLRDLRHGSGAALRLEDRHVDLLAQMVAAETGAALIVARAPRAMIDLNRAPDDIDWEMFVREARPAGPVPVPSRRARSGLGLIPRRLPGMGDLWRRRFAGSDLADRLAGVHAPYHAAVGDGLAALRERWGAVLLIDLHSMPPLPLPSVAGAARVQVVVGDRFGASCHGSVAAECFAALAACGREAAHNRPYAGGYVLERHADPSRGVHALQLEVDRSCYLDAAMVEPGEGLATMARDLAVLVRRLAGRVCDLGEDGQGGAWPLAAE